ncbi:30S ribosomal protein S9 [Candidatus Berkelbacteria bacterium CG_4_9_14_0_2_um_filter_42_30]|uniref:Small ribosomal subunit protein uS9 n=5 Tax=Candidatus Berkelbacteria TaxID=1618330 RepID=A0A2H0AZG1_9BACT|nr:MAG: 30S ribosomal protein S9 [Candidatus Berkelbacteria bacterium CG1_02_42_45]PIP50802.1 MAG: 30S ribosomal protein S9 [Candidatus Berkelbacteria bacterium CG23_combo_of_CG06-09_8_20_14_all_41_73]PIR27503.1 MAG: 30S ribosomal protein S9 [Candidatus Berkelbacteria bacterium CG11_big_fil_rev_8_21_14_0_20_42_15]PIZ27572.1 MAG: 30S ribosomal protein S9 [Candidatus Berkelbacteria bacterium CG_4_10_14_0_8_um_filter_42_34]PJC65768.1 MAG: 30S ribosomal protein S9 [Candidatus Berkelbacteria bacteri
MPKSPENKYFYGTGRRKTAVARVRIYPGNGKCLVNNKESTLPEAALSPLKLVGKYGDFDLSVLLSGGGKTGQIEATKLGLARALISLNPEFRPTLKKAGFLTRDQREVERKKPGLKKARRAPQWSKR